jgi:preprotein translocase subunit YajC
MKRTLLFAAVLGCVATVSAQPQERGGRNFPPGDTVTGKVISISKDSLVIEPLSGGNTVTVKVSDNTRVNKDRQPAKLEDIKAGDVVFVRGELNNGILQSRMVGVVNPQMLERMQQGGTGGGFSGGRGGGAGEGFNREDWGKKFILGEVKAINETRLTIARPDGQTAEIEVDENTSFKRGNESVTFPEIKVGDFVRGPGELKNHVFVTKELIVGRPQMRMMGDAGKQNPPPDKPATSAPPKN